MPLTGQAKTDYQRKYMREYMKRRRAGIKAIKEAERPVMPVRPVRGGCRYCGGKLPVIAPCCDTCARVAHQLNGYLKS